MMISNCKYPLILMVSSQIVGTLKVKPLNATILIRSISPSKSQLLEIKCVFKNRDSQMFDHIWSHMSKLRIRAHASEHIQVKMTYKWKCMTAVSLLRFRSTMPSYFPLLQFYFERHNINEYFTFIQYSLVHLTNCPHIVNRYEWLHICTWKWIFNTSFFCFPTITF